MVIFCCIISHHIQYKNTFNVQVFMVTGGRYPPIYGSLLDSTEIYNDRVWRTVAGKLPVYMKSLRASALNDRVLFFGKKVYKKMFKKSLLHWGLSFIELGAEFIYFLRWRRSRLEEYNFGVQHWDWNMDSDRNYDRGKNWFCSVCCSNWSFWKMVQLIYQM